ncbi:MAG: metal-dependent hydrolase with the TIM-barrel fold protein [Alkaliphilus sp.]|nr:MAG: metal-dependent hydrolase with the TIM-barrel fold protein [Alkaliphilus sp.]
MKVYSGQIISCNNKMDTYSYLVENNGIIEFVGNDLPQKYSELGVINLGERALLPAFVDSHIHLSSYALFATTLDIREIKDFKDLESILVAYEKQHKPKMMLAFGISDRSVKEKILITKEILDKMPISTPVLLVKSDGHTCVVNTLMLDMIPEKIRKLRGFNSDTGQLFQEGFSKTIDFATSKVSIPQLVKSMLAGIDKLADYGIGTVHAVEGIGFFMDLDITIVKLLAKGLMNPFNIRIFFQTTNAKKAKKKGLKRLGGCFATALDGSFGSKDAAISLPYTGTDNTGILFYKDQEVNDFIEEAHNMNLQVSVHAIGDLAFEQALVAYEQAIKNYPREDHRHTIIHACLANKEQLERAGRIGLHLSVQPGFIDWDLEPYDYMEEILGDRVERLNGLKSMINAGVTVSAGSDAPVTVPNPIEGIHNACNHYNREEALSMEEALRMYTYYGAYATFDEDVRGTLEVGKYADMIILNKNPLLVSLDEIRELKVEKLFLKGKDYKKNQTVWELILKNFKNRNVEF